MRKREIFLTGIFFNYVVTYAWNFFLDTIRYNIAISIIVNQGSDLLSLMIDLIILNPMSYLIKTYEIT